MTAIFSAFERKQVLLESSRVVTPAMTRARLLSTNEPTVMLTSTSVAGNPSSVQRPSAPARVSTRTT